MRGAYSSLDVGQHCYARCGMIAPTRRAILIGATASAIPAAALVAASHPDAELIALCAECERLEITHGQVCWSDDEQDHRFGSLEQQQALVLFTETSERQEAVMDQITATPARTPEGLRAKAEACHAYFKDWAPEGGSRGGDMLWSLVCDMAGRDYT